MAEAHSIREGMQVIGSDGGAIGTVSGIEGDAIAVRSAGEHGGAHHHIPSRWVARVDGHVHLDRPAALARETWTAHGAPEAAHHSRVEVADDASGSSWFRIVAWGLLVVLVLWALYALVGGLLYDAGDPGASSDGEIVQG